MQRPRSGKVQGLALALLALLIVGAGILLFLQGPGAPPPVIEGEPDATAQPPVERGHLGADPEPGGRAPLPEQRVEIEIGGSDLAGESGQFGAPVSGRVLDEGGAPVAEAKVWLSARFKFGQAPPEHPVEDDPRFYRTTDARGAFRFDRLIAGQEMELWAWHPEFAARSGIAFAALGNEPQELPPIVLPAGAALTGVVQDTGGNPLRASVELGLQDRQSFRAGSFEQQREQDLRLGRLRVQQTDDRGRFEFRGVAEGAIWTLRGVAEGYATAEIPALFLQPGKAPEEQVLVMDSEHLIRGVVLNDERLPVAGAVITVSRTQPRPVFTTQGRSEADGSFTLRGLPSGYYGLAATVEGYGYGRVPRVETDSPPVEVVLPKKGGVSGRVTGPDGEPIARYSLELMRTRGKGEQMGPTELTWQIQDPNGAYRIEGLDPGTFVLLARAAGYCPSYSPSFPVQREIVLGMDVQMDVGGSLSGVVQAGGRPVAGARVSVHGPRYVPPSGAGFFGQDSSDPDNVPSVAAVSAADGAFRIEHAMPGEMVLYVQHPRHLPEIVRITVPQRGEAECGVIELAAGAAIFGVVLDGADQPVSGATVNVTSQEGDQLAQHTGLTDARGRFRVEGLRAGSYEVVAFPADAIWLIPPENQVQRVYLAEGKEQEVRLRVEKDE